jgi:hypothetical protein
VAELLSGLREAWGQAVQSAGAGRAAGGEK